MLNSAAPVKDSDQDGMPDTWETQHRFAVQDASDNNQDADGDGYLNLEEFLNGTDPNTLSFTEFEKLFQLIFV